MPSRNPARRIVVVDDDPRVRHAMCQLIDGTPGLGVVAAVGSAVAVDVASETAAPDLAVVDVNLADRNSGLSLIRILSHRIPVIAISATSSLARPAIRAGATTFCDKDGNTDALVNAVLAALGDDPHSGRTR